MAYFKPLPKPEPDKRIRYLAEAGGLLKPGCMIQYERREWTRCGHVPYYEHVVMFDGIDFRRIIGMYVYKSNHRSGDVPTDAVKGDIIEYVPVSYV